MEEVKVCRICLVMDVKMYDLRSHPLNLYIGSLTDSNILTIVNSPPYACYLCAALVKKFYIFKQKWLESQDLLNSLIDNSSKITHSKLKEIDRSSLGCSLSAYIIPGQPIENFLNSELITKKEQVTLDQNTLSTELIIKEEPAQIDQSIINADEKEENYLPSPAYRELSSDDEDMSISCKEEVQMSGDEDILDPLKNLQPTKAVSNLGKKTNKTKQLRDSLADDITVINLSLMEQIEELNKMKESPEYLNASYKCDKCCKWFYEEYGYQRHLLKHSLSAGDIECMLCKYRYPTKTGMTGHLERHRMRYACKHCPRVYVDLDKAKMHAETHKGVQYTCKECLAVYNDKAKYLHHLRTKHPMDFICNLCGLSFRSEVKLNRHQAADHKALSTSQPYIQNGTKLKDGIIPEDGPYCEECDVKFMTMEAYERHMIESLKHNKNKSHRARNYKCPECDSTFFKLHNLRNHEATHSDARPFICSTCDKRFKTKSTLLVHLKIHSAEKVQCDICQKWLNSESSLRYHLKTIHPSDPSKVRRRQSKPKKKVIRQVQ